jgi:hypothetical protein
MAGRAGRPEAEFLIIVPIQRRRQKFLMLFSCVDLLKIETGCAILDEESSGQTLVRAFRLCKNPRSSVFIFL